MSAEISKNKAGFKDLVSCLQYNANLTQSFGLNPIVAAALASSCLRTQAAKIQTECVEEPQGTCFPALREWQHWGEAGTASPLSTAAFKIGFI